MRSRNRLLEQPSPDAHWLDAIEHETAEVAIAVAAARAETVRRLAAALMRDRDPASPFPWAGIALDGWVENALMEQPATEVEDRYRAVLRDNRARDAAAGRTTDGPHLTDLEVLYGPKGIAASAGLDRRAEGAADRAGAGACGARRRDDAACAAAAAR